jgi:hypothetical protein
MVIDLLEMRHTQSKLAICKGSTLNWIPCTRGVRNSWHDCDGWLVVHQWIAQLVQHSKEGQATSVSQFFLTFIML